MTCVGPSDRGLRHAVDAPETGDRRAVLAVEPGQRGTFDAVKPRESDASRAPASPHGEAYFR